MMVLRNVAPALAVLFMAALGNGLSARQAKNQQEGVRHDQLDALSTQLGLDAKQKDQVQKICSDFDQKERPVVHELWSLYIQECDAALQALTPEQRTKVPEVMKEARAKELDKIAPKLGLSNDQKQRIREICEKYQPQFLELTKQTDDKGFQRMQELRHEVFAAIRPILTEEQRAKVPGVLREEYEMWHDPAAQAAHVQAFEDKLNLDNTQRNQVHKIVTDFKQKLEKPRAELQQICQQEQTAVEKVLTDQQRTKFEQFVKTHNK